MKIALIDYNMGNLASVQNAFKKMGASCELVSDPDKLQNYDKAILPGVGAFGDAMEHLGQTGMKQAVREYGKSGKFMLGICLGMQVLFEKGFEFGEHEGLGLIPGRIVPFDKERFAHPLKVPHMGWNELFVQKETSIFQGMEREFYLYFVHSYHAQTEDEYVIGKTFYGYEFVSAVQKDNIIGLQPHPEKSHENGLKIVKNFIELT